MGVIIYHSSKSVFNIIRLKIYINLIQVITSNSIIKVTVPNYFIVVYLEHCLQPLNNNVIITSIIWPRTLGLDTK